jgi:DinB superfamily
VAHDARGANEEVQSKDPDLTRRHGAFDGRLCDDRLMHPRVREVLECLDAHHTDLQRAMEDVPVALRDRRPGPERWSVAEILDHLALVEERIVQLITRELADARARGLGPERGDTPVVATLDPSRLVDRSRRLIASEAAQPLKGVDAASARARLERARQTTRDVLLRADGLALADVTAPNPVLGPLNVYQWVLFVAGHEGRHAAQIREIGAALASS